MELAVNPYMGSTGIHKNMLNYLNVPVVMIYKFFLAYTVHIDGCFPQIYDGLNI